MEGRLLSRDKYQRRVAQALANGVRDFADKVLARRLVAQASPPTTRTEPPAVNAAGVVASPVGTR